MKNRNLIIYLLLSITALNADTSKTILIPATAITPLTPKNTVFLWDFHDVLAKRNKRKTLSTVWNFPKKGTVLRKMNRTLLCKMFKMIGNSATTSEELIHVIRDQNNPELEELIYQVANIQEPIPGTVALIQELHRMGYQHYIGSNIGSSIFADLINPLKHPQFAPLFSQFNLEHPQTVDFELAHPEKTIKKPAPEFYQEFLRKNNIDLATTNVIFVDDRLENVRAAQKAGFIGIHFKYPSQLRKDLHWLGVQPFARSGQTVMN